MNDIVLLYKEYYNLAIVANPIKNKSIIIERVQKQNDVSTYIRNVKDFSIYFEQEYTKYNFDNFKGFYLYNKSYKNIIIDKNTVTVNSNITLEIVASNILKFSHKIFLEHYLGKLCF